MRQPLFGTSGTAASTPLSALETWPQAAFPHHSEVRPPATVARKTPRPIRRGLSSGGFACSSTFGNGCSSPGNSAINSCLLRIPTWRRRTTPGAAGRTHGTLDARGQHPRLVDGLRRRLGRQRRAARDPARPRRRAGDQQWVVDAYLLTLGSLILVGGSLGDIFGERRSSRSAWRASPVPRCSARSPRTHRRSSSSAACRGWQAHCSRRRRSR